MPDNKQAVGEVPAAYYYNRQLRKYILQFMAVFTGFQVSIGKRRTGSMQQETDCDGNVINETPIMYEDRLISVPIHYGSQDRVVASILAENTQVKPLRLPIMSAYMKGIEYNKTYAAGLGQERRNAYLPSGGLIPDDIKVVHQLKPVPYSMSMELAIFTSNMDEHFQLLEQILMLFNPSVQIQTTDSLFAWDKITTIELDGITPETNYPSGPDRRVIQTSLSFNMPIYLSAPADVRRDFIEKILMRVGVVSTSTDNNYDIIAELDAQGTTVPVTGVSIPQNTWTVLTNVFDKLKEGSKIEIITNSGNGNGQYTVQSVNWTGTNSIITVIEAIPTGATPDGDCRLPFDYELIISSDDLGFQ